MPKKISSTDLLWVFRERLALRNARFKDIPIAIVPSGRDWAAVTSARHRNSTARLAKHIKEVEQELRPIYRLAR